MRILVVNGLNLNEIGVKRFDDFYFAIQRIMADHKEIEPEILKRDTLSLDDYLYEIESSHLRKESANNFDQLDMIFIIGETNVRPWDPSMRKLLTLIRMCVRVKKYLYASSWAMQALVFLCASNLEKNINIINGKGEGGKLADIHLATDNLKSIKPNDYYLDNTTGDLLGFNYETSEWIPKGNCGLHCRVSAQEFQSIGKYIVKAPTYKANTEHHLKYKLYKSRKLDETCRIKKMHLHHWLFEGLEDEFIVSLMNRWDIHTFSFINPQKHFNCLADSERGPIVIEMENIVGVLFYSEAKNKKTIIPLENFIQNTLKKIKSQSVNQTPSISSYQFQQRESTVEENLRKQKEKSKRPALVLLNKRAQEMGFHQIDADTQNQAFTKSDVFLHVGFSAKRSHMPQYVYHNMVNDQKLKIDELHMKKKPAIRDGGDHTHHRIEQSRHQQIEQKEVIYPIGNCENAGKIREFLHPDISKEMLHSNKLWIPGNLSDPNNPLKRGLQVMTQTGSSFYSSHHRKNLGKSESTTTLVKSPVLKGKDFGEFKSLFARTPYISPEEVYKKEIKERQSKIIGDKDFRVGTAELDYNSVYKLQSDFNAGCPPSAYFRHQFREQHKEKWINPHNFKLI